MEIEERDDKIINEAKDIGNVFLTLEEKDDKFITENEKKLIAPKKKTRKVKKFKDLGLLLLGKKTKNIPNETSKLQELFNAVSKSGDFTKENIQQVAARIQYKVDESSLNLISSLGKAKVSISRIGIPSNLCKRKMHLYGTINSLFKNLRVITDDSLVWEAFGSTLFFSGGEYSKKLKRFL